MRYTVPDYYKKFRCLAGECPQTCCAGWQIVIDDRSMKKYASAKGTFGNRIRNSVDFQEHTFHQYDKRCAFLNDDNLCDMHIEAGVDLMCNTCRKYPRHIEVFDNEREISLSMSCPAVAKLILGQKRKASWTRIEDDKRDRTAEDFDDFLYSALQDTRSLMISFLQDRQVPIHLRMAEVLALAHDVQNRIRCRQIFDIQNVLNRYSGEHAGKMLRKKIQRENRIRKDNLLVLLRELEVLNPSWRWDVERWEDMECPSMPYEIPEVEMEQMAVYFIFTYFCGAVYDGDALAKAKMSMVSVLIWENICWKTAEEKQGELTEEERIELAVRYSRELEHSDPNLNKMEELMNDRPEVSLERLLGYLA